MPKRSPSRPRKTNGAAAARALLGSAGLTLPLIPEELAPRFKKREKWCFASRPLRMSPYNLFHFVKESITGRVRDYVVVAHAGHGVNSYAMHYYLVRRPLYLFLQVGWGGVYMDEQEATSEVNDAFALAGRLAEATERAVRNGRLQSDARLMIVSSFGEGVLYPPGCDDLGDFGPRRSSGHPGAVSPRRFGTAAEALHEALGLLASLPPQEIRRETAPR